MKKLKIKETEFENLFSKSESLNDSLIKANKEKDELLKAVEEKEKEIEELNTSLHNAISAQQKSNSSRRREWYALWKYGP